MSKLFRKIGDKLEDWGIKDKKLLIWDQETIGEDERALILVIPSPEAEKLKYDIRAIQKFAIRDYERVLLLDKGSLTDVLSGGVYELAKEARTKATQLIYIDTGTLKIPWGFPQMTGPRTKDGIQIGISGSMILSITDPRAFAMNLLSRHKSFSDKQLRDWIKDTLQGVLREIIKDYELTEVGTIKRDIVYNSIETETIKTFERYGLTLQEFNIVNLNVPPQYAHLLERAAERVTKIARAEDMLDDMELQKAIEKRKIEQELELESMKLQKDKILAERQLDLKSTVEVGGARLERELADISSGTRITNARTRYQEIVLEALGDYQKTFKGGLADVELAGLRKSIETGAELSKMQMEMLEKVLLKVTEITRYEGLADKINIAEFARAEAMQIAAGQPDSRAEFGTHPPASHQVTISKEDRKAEIQRLKADLKKVEKQITEADDKLLDGTLSEDAHKALMARLEKRKRAIKEELAKLGA